MLFTFLSIAVTSVMVMLIVAISLGHREKIKKLEVEGLQIQKSNLQNEVNDAVERQLRDTISRIEVLEAIVTDKNYELNEKIHRLKK